MNLHICEEILVLVTNYGNYKVEKNIEIFEYKYGLMLVIYNIT